MSSLLWSPSNTAGRITFFCPKTVSQCSYPEPSLPLIALTNLPNFSEFTACQYFTNKRYTSNHAIKLSADTLPDTTSAQTQTNNSVTSDSSLTTVCLIVTALSVVCWPFPAGDQPHVHYR